MDYRVFNARTDVNACDCTRGCTGTVRESALKSDSGRKIPCRTEESNLRQRRDDRTVSQLNFITTMDQFIPLHGESQAVAARNISIFFVLDSCRAVTVATAAQHRCGVATAPPTGIRTSSLFPRPSRLFRTYVSEQLAYDRELVHKSLVGRYRCRSKISRHIFTDKLADIQAETKQKKNQAALFVRGLDGFTV